MTVKLFEAVRAHRRRKAHAAYLREHNRQRALNAQDVQDASGRESLRSASKLQSGFFS